MSIIAQLKKEYSKIRPNKKQMARITIKFFKINNYKSHFKIKKEKNKASYLMTTGLRYFNI